MTGTRWAKRFVAVGLLLLAVEVAAITTWWARGGLVTLVRAANGAAP